MPRPSRRTQEQIAAVAMVDADREAYLEDLVRIYREEVKDLAAEGCTYLQIDDTTIAMMGADGFAEAAQVAVTEASKTLRGRSDVTAISTPLRR